MVIGDVDSRTAATLAQQIAVESRAGTTSVTRDLSSLTHQVLSLVQLPVAESA